MAGSLEDLRILQAAEAIADDMWKLVGSWDALARETVGSQLVRAFDSIGANIAEAFGCYHFGERLQFIYYARGSLFESKYWINRAGVRGLISQERASEVANQLTELAKQLNSFAGSLKSQKGAASPTRRKRVEEQPALYNTTPPTQDENLPFTSSDLEWLSTLPVYPEE